MTTMSSRESLGEEYVVWVVRNTTTGLPTHETWWLNGIVQRHGGGPSVTFWDDDGKLSFQQWLVDRELHREDGPALIAYAPDGSITREEYQVHGKFHRDGDLPARISKDSESGDFDEAYFVNGEFHRSNGPASTYVDGFQGTTTEGWYRYGQRHRIDGPAVIVRNTDTGKVVELEYYRHGRLVKPPKPSPRPG